MCVYICLFVYVCIDICVCAIQHNKILIINSVEDVLIDLQYKFQKL